MASEQVRYALVGDRRLGRHVNHDPLSKAYPVRRARRVSLHSVRHVRHVPVFQQADLGRCVPTAALGCMGTGAFHQAYLSLAAPPYPLTEDGCIQAYRDVTKVDPFPGAWEPEDTGSDGLSMAKVLHKSAAISGYQHAFSLSDLLAELLNRPCIVGTEWTSSMFETDEDALVMPAIPAVGGHEYIADELIVAGDRFGPRNTVAEDTVIGFTNSWGTDWGHEGRFFMYARDFGPLLSRRGDATFFVPATEPAPTPIPDATDPDVVLANKLRDWAAQRHGPSIKARKAMRAWLEAKGL